MASGMMSILPYYGATPKLPSIQPNPLPGQPPTNPVPTTPNFQDIYGSLNNPNRQIGGNANFEKGIQAAQPYSGISPETQHILDMIRQNQNYSQGQGVAQAQSLAAKRGITGSSTEQFGTQEAIGQASRAAQDAQANVLLENLKRNQSLQDLQAQGYFNRANQEGQVGAQINNSLANLTSDEIASLRNMSFQDRSLALQQLLGQQGIDVAQQNINAQKDINKNNSEMNLIGQIGQGVTPWALGKLFPSGANVPGTAGTTGRGITGIANIGGTGKGFLGFGGAGGSPLAAGAEGPASPGLVGPGGALFNSAGTSAIGAGNVLPGVAGWQLGTHAFGDNRYTNTGGIAGAVGGSLFGPAGSAAGGFIGAGLGGLSNQAANQVSNHLGNTAGSVLRYSNPLTAIPDTISKLSNPSQTIKSVTSSVSNAVSKVFPF